MRQYKYIIVGGGLAGLYTAFHLSSLGKVAIITKDKISDSNSYFAQGGMAAVITRDDTTLGHLEDTLVAGRGLCLPESVKVLVEEAPKRIEDLMTLGMQFDTEKGTLTLGLEGGHHHHRILHAGGDATGRLVTSFMIDKVKATPSIEIFDHHLLLDFITDNEHCIGIATFNTNTQQKEYFLSDATILAMGGLAALYHPSTNPPTTLGDGIALAIEHGIKVMDLEFVQFHPTALTLKGVPPFLISEAVRGEGAYLLNNKGERFMIGKHPQAELAPRDIVAACIYKEMLRTGEDHVYLSLRHMDSTHLKSRFPTIAQHCQDFGVDFTQEIPIAPAAHYTVGGIATDLHGATSLDGLYAVGEVASTGMMGANRLASNSLIECLVMGYRIVENLKMKGSTYSLSPSSSILQKIAKEEAKAPVEASTSSNDESIVLLEWLGKELMHHVGIVRTASDLQKAIHTIGNFLEEDWAKGESSLSPIETLLMKRRFHLAQWIAKAALSREETRGNHLRSDFPETLPNEKAYRTVIQNHTLQQQPL